MGLYGIGLNEPFGGLRGLGIRGLFLLFGSSGVGFFSRLGGFGGCSSQPWPRKGGWKGGEMDMMNMMWMMKGFFNKGTCGLLAFERA